MSHPKEFLYHIAGYKVKTLSVDVYLGSYTHRYIHNIYLCIELLVSYRVNTFGLILVVVVVNHCFTSLFGTNGLLSDIVIR